MSTCYLIIERKERKKKKIEITKFISIQKFVFFATQDFHLNSFFSFLFILQILYAFTKAKYGTFTTTNKTQKKNEFAKNTKRKIQT